MTDTAMQHARFQPLSDEARDVIVAWIDAFAPIYAAETSAEDAAAFLTARLTTVGITPEATTFDPYANDHECPVAEATSSDNGQTWERRL